MCGIVGYVGNNNVTDVLVDGLRKLEYRGYDSAGIAVFEGGTISVVKTKGRLDDLDKKLKSEHSPKGLCGIGHTRWATHGEPSDVNSHPHAGKKAVLVHNGIIENYLTIKEFLTAKGYVFESETDTETIAKLLDYHYNGNPLETLKKVCSELKGSYALGVLFADFPGEIFAVRKDSPLIVAVGESETFIASDIPAILKYTRQHYLLDENEFAHLTDQGVLFYDSNLHPVKKPLLTAEWDIEAAEKGGFEHFMIKEIHEEPDALKKTVSPKLDDQLLPDFKIPALPDERFATFEKIHIVACGTAMHAGIVGKYAIEKLAGVPVEVDIASEFRYRNPILGKNDLVVIISQSGETADTLAALRLAKDAGVYTLAVVNVVGSSIAREADGIISTWAGPEIAVASTKAYVVQLGVMYLLAVKLGLVRGVLSEERAVSLCSDLTLIPDKIQTIIENCEECKAVAEKIYTSPDLFYIGRGLDYALALECSLKLKEISYIHCEAYAAGELKHGTISLITDGVPVIAITTQKELYEKMISNIKEVKARGASVFMIACKGAENASQVAEHILEIPDCDPMLTPLLVAPIFQFIAYYASVLKGCDVDKPRNLAKSVTVE